MKMVKLHKMLSNNQIARLVFAEAESLGLSDRDKIDQLTDRIINHLEPKPLPGMEHLLLTKEKYGYRASSTEIEAMVRKILKEGITSAKESAMPVNADTSVNNKIALSYNAIHVLERRYLKKDKQGTVVETPEDMFRRVARKIASAEHGYDSKANVLKWEDAFYHIMTSLEFLPNSPTLMNAGNELGQLSACFVLPIEDSMDSIFETVKHTALIHKSGGGTGFSFSRLRPAMDRVGTTGGVASGPVSFMRAFDTATDVIKQGGMRRGANMAILDVDHPDIMEFIAAKEDPSALTNFNLSVAITDKFMDAVNSATDFNLINPRTKEISGSLNARLIFDKLVDMAWRTGDPGVIFIDRINEQNPTPQLGRIESTNPCGEQPLLPYESCNLGSINLSRMIKHVNDHIEIDYKKLSEVIRLAVRFLDNVIDVNQFPLREIENITKQNRKIGLGVMGFADLLILLNIPYNSQEALRIASEVMEFINNEALKSSVDLGMERGVFPGIKNSIYDSPEAPKPRNASRTTIAPTGTLSIIAGCSSGIEPLYALSYVRNILDGAQLTELNPQFEKMARNRGFYSKELMNQITNGRNLADIDDIPPDMKKVFITAHNISPEWHIKMQAAFQKSTNNAVSKTINFPNQATRNDIAKSYLMAYEEGLKGITIYRDRSRNSQVLVVDNKGESDRKQPDMATTRTPRRRTKVTKGVTEKVTTGCGNMYVTVNSDDKGICEVFSTLGKAGGCASAQLEATCRLISLALRTGVEVTSIARQLRGIRCPSIAWEEGKSVLSCADAIASVLEKHIHKDDERDNNQNFGTIINLAGQCPECGNLLVFQEGCFICPSCGYTKC